MTRIAIVSAACAFAMAVSATLAAAEESTEEMLARDAAVVQACLDVAEARREAADAPREADSPGEMHEAEKKTGPEGHLEAASPQAGYAPKAASACSPILAWRPRRLRPPTE